MSNELKGEIKVPKRVFIVPYRSRVQHKFFFSKYMSFILENCDDYEIYFSHQCDARTFNRGATKNIGFLAVKEKYPNDYKDIDKVFEKKFELQPPLVIIPLVDTKIFIENPAFLSCKIIGRPFPKVNFYRKFLHVFC